MQNKILLSDLAKAANCSISQASRAMNGKPNVAAEIRERVRQAALKLNYRNTANRHLPNIAILKNYEFHFYTSQIINALENTLKKTNWKWQIIDTSNVEMINEFFHDGIISIASSEFIANQLPQLMNMPMVVINNYGVPVENICSVDPDPYQESYLVLEHLKMLGHRKIARIKLIPDFGTKRDLTRGDTEFMAAANALNLHFSVENFNYEKDSDLKEILHHVVSHGFTAIFMIHQHLAVSISSWLHSLKIAIPEDISLVTYEIPEVTEYLFPPQTTLDFDFPEIARIAVELLRKRMKGEMVPVSIKAMVKLNVRSSTKKINK